MGQLISNHVFSLPLKQQTKFPEKKKHHRFWGIFPPLRDKFREKRNTSTSTSTHKTVALSMSTGLALQVLAEAICELLHGCFSLSLSIQGQTKWVKTSLFFLLSCSFLTPKSIDDICFDSWRWCHVWDVEKGTCKILPLVKRGGRFCVDPEASLLV